MRPRLRGVRGSPACIAAVSMPVLVKASLMKTSAVSYDAKRYADAAILAALRASTADLGCARADDDSRCRPEPTVPSSSLQRRFALMLKAASTTAPARRITRWRFSTVLPP